MLIGIIEEIPYRGFMLQKLARADTAATIFVFGVVMAIVFKFSRSFWAPILTHGANDFLSFVVFGR